LKRALPGDGRVAGCCGPGTWPQANPEEAMAKAGCMACHAKDKKLVGPSFKDIAAKYKGQDVVATLMREGAQGRQGRLRPGADGAQRPEKINDADLKAAVEFILKS
jgi:cytochrome c